MGCRKKINKKDITLSHYAMRSWASSCYGSWQLYGHSHGRMPEFNNLLSFDVGVDVWGYVPIPWEVIVKKMSLKNPKIVDGETIGILDYEPDPNKRAEALRIDNLALLDEMGITYLS